MDFDSRILGTTTRLSGGNPAFSYNSMVGLHYLFEFGTTTPGKFADYSAISAGLSRQTAWRLAFEPINKHVTHHAAVEDGHTGALNAEKKLNDVLSDFRRLAPGHDLHHAFRRRLARQGVSFCDGSRFVAERIVGIVEDSTTALPPAIWHNMLPRLRGLVVPDALKTSPREVDGKEYICVTDIGPITSAVGTRQFWSMAREAAHRSGYGKEPVPVLIQASCAFSLLSDSEGARRGTLERDVLFHLYTPHGLIKRVTHANAHIPVAEHFLSHPDRPHQPAAADYGVHLLTTSVRRAVLQQFITEYAVHQPAQNQNVVPFPDSAAPPDRRATKRRAARIRLIQPTMGANAVTPGKRIGNIAVINRGNGANGAFKESVFLNAMSMEFDLRKAKPEHADALILGPFDPRDPAQRIYNAAIFHAAVDAKLLDPRYQEVPLVVMNLRGCWDGIIQSHIAYASAGYSKEFVRHPVHDGSERTVITQPGVRHLPLHFVNVLSGNEERPLRAAAEQFLDSRLAHYHRSHDILHGLQEGGVPKPVGLFALTTFGSASSDRLQANVDAAYSGKLAARNDWGFVTGGGDQHVMGAMIDGYVSGRKGPWLAGISTHNIIKVETRNGHIPRECDYWALSDTITPRLIKLSDFADAYLSVGGGNGTGHEGAFILAQMHFTPEKMAGKAIAFIGHDKVKLAELRSFVGADNVRRLLKDGDAMHEQGVHLRPDMKSAGPLLHELKAAFDRRLARASPRRLQVG